MVSEYSIKSIPLEKLNNDEYAQFMKGVINLVSGATLEKLSVSEALFNGIRQHQDLLTEASRQSRQSQETEKITQVDKQRTEVLSYLLSSFRLEQKNIDANRRASALVLFREFKNYIGTQSLPVRQKSQAIDAFIKDIRKPQLASHLNTLGLLRSVDALEGYNESYQKLLEGRAESQVATSLINVKQVRKETNQYYKDVVKYAGAMNVIHPTLESGNFVALLNKLIDDTMLSNKQRLSQLASARAAKVVTNEKAIVNDNTK